MCNKCNCETPKAPEREPFNLERAKAGEPIETREGQKAHFIGVAPSGQPVVAQIGWSVFRFNDNGSFFPKGQEAQDDLFMAPKPKKSVTVYLALTKYGVGKFPDRKRAEEKCRHINSTILGGVQVTVTEGEFDGGCAQ